ncbi:MAG: hypothetical protein LBU69_02130, partial [Deltaproteobacteria bacterium]|nr:hypothetical protein [Deltaproteobacteria bacterium]
MSVFSKDCLIGFYNFIRPKKYPILIGLIVLALLGAIVLFATASRKTMGTNKAIPSPSISAPAPPETAAAGPLKPASSLEPSGEALAPELAPPPASAETAPADAPEPTAEPETITEAETAPADAPEPSAEPETITEAETAPADAP